MPFVGTFESPNSGRKRIEECYRADETETVKTLLGIADLGAGRRARIQARARNLVEGIRSRGTGAEGLDAFLQEYELSNREGVVLILHRSFSGMSGPKFDEGAPDLAADEPRRCRRPKGGSLLSKGSSVHSAAPFSRCFDRKAEISV